jgi:hypothetical protein
MNSQTFDRKQTRNRAQRRAFVKRWAEYVRTHDDADWSRQQRKLIDSQFQNRQSLRECGSLSVHEEDRRSTRPSQD